MKTLLHVAALTAAPPAGAGRLTAAPFVIALGAAVAFPLVVHLLPAFGGIPVGARLLPLFVVPLAALWYARTPVALVAAVGAPLLSFWLTGRPAWPLPGLLAVELAAFVGVVALLNGRRGLRWGAPLLAFAGAKGLGAAVLAAAGGGGAAYVLQAFALGWPGLLLLTLLQAVLVGKRRRVAA